MDAKTDDQSLGRRFQDKVAIITGSTAGIGLATAIRLGKEGAKGVLDTAHLPATATEFSNAACRPQEIHCAVVISSRRQSAVDDALKLMRQQGIACIGMPCHVGSDEQRAALIAFAIKARYHCSLQFISIFLCLIACCSQ